MPTEPLVAICLATHNPPAELFERQIETIRAQSHERFVCLISDDASEPQGWERIERAAEGDPRFVVSRAPSRLGFYRNFERCLSLVPETASYVALCDQDDRWHRDKIATLVGELQSSDAVLAFSDMHVARADGRLIATTYWLDRKNNFTELGTLLLSNTVTGGASLFRRELLDDVLPFPPDVGEPYHDHWIACVALALGEIAYVDRPLYDYVQHPENLLGHPAPSTDLKGGLLHALVRLVAQPRRRLTSTARHAGLIYRRDVVRVELFARTLELRLGDRIVRSRAKDVHRAARIGTSPASVAWLLGRSARDVRGRSATLGVENQLLKGIAWRHWQAVRARFRR
jgi:glycosyltransferase involved in cell wall biosynthesis